MRSPTMPAGRRATIIGGGVSRGAPAAPLAPVAAPADRKDSSWT